jgi:hypothetical protein
MLVERIEVERDWPGWERGYSVGLLAGIRERQGRVDDAVALLHTRYGSTVNGRDQLADLLARHGRIDELRAYAATGDDKAGMQRLAKVLEERGDVEGAIAVYRQPGDSVRRRVFPATLLASLLIRHGRVHESAGVTR